MARPLVSIVTPAYNSAAFIADTIWAALAQTCADFEFLIVDDESSDGTIEAIHRAAAGDPRVVVMVSPHGGPAAARNVALDAARGRFIALLDSDDVWMPSYLEQQLQLLSRFRDCAIVTANAINRGGPLDGRPLWPAIAGTRKLAPRDLIVEGDAVCIMSVFRREVIDRVGGFDPAFNGNEDYEFWLRAVNGGFRIVRNHQPMGYYRRRPDSVSSNEIRMLNGIVRVLDSISRADGRLAAERDVVARQVRLYRQEIVKAQLRASFAKSDGEGAAAGLKTLSELSGSWKLALAARLGMTWPQLLLRAYDLKRSLRAS
jgi:teichuronic acid biosynthesis glycosyltransferase TuaG